LGRKTKLTPALQDKMIEALRVGAVHEDACQYAGIDHATFYRWLQKGEAGQAPYREFCEAIKEAEGKAVVGWLAEIERAARAGNWQAAAWKLERRRPKAYGRQPFDAVAAPPPDIHVHIHTARERLSTRLEHLAQRHGEDAAGVN
jgi:alpha-galactosidase/6-phospho-beta-glucosidase family protein